MRAIAPLHRIRECSVDDNTINYALATPSPTTDLPSHNDSKETGIGTWEPSDSAPHFKPGSDSTVAEFIKWDASEYHDDDPTLAIADSYFARNRKPQPDIVEDLIGESKITVLGGDYGVGKS